MTFVRLFTTDRQEIFVNPAHVVAIVPASNHSSILDMVDTKAHIVEGRPGEVCDALEQAMRAE